MWLELMQERMADRRNLTVLHKFKNGTAAIEREWDAFTLHIPVKKGKYGSPANDVMVDAREAVAELEAAGFEAGIWHGPTGAIFVYVEVPAAANGTPGYHPQYLERFIAE